MDGNEVLHNEKGIVSKMTANGDEIKLDNDVISITSGKIKGNIEALDDIEESKKSLDNFAKTMAEAINTVHEDEFFLVEIVQEP